MKLIIPKAIEEKIHAYVMCTEGEIAGMGKVRTEGEDTIIVEDVMIYEQEATGGTADLSPQAIAKWQTALVKAGGSPKHWRLWWHSHANMEAFFSDRDVRTIDSSNEGEWMCSLVVNKRREREARLDMYRPFRMYMDKLDVKIEGEHEYKVPPEIAAEVAQKVKKPSYIGFGDPLDTASNGKSGTIKSPSRTIAEILSLHQYCPMSYSEGREKTCYLPYGENAQGVFADCTTAQYKKMYGGYLQTKRTPKDDDDEMEEAEYSTQQVLSIIKTLEEQIRYNKEHGLAHAPETHELQIELADWYYELAEREADPNTKEMMRAEAGLIEAEAYD